MKTEIIPLLTFVLVTTFTPGPGNITSAAMGMMYGYSRSFPFLTGIVAGYLMIMVLCAFFSRALLDIIPSFEPVLRIVGASYILWLAVGTARATYNLSSDKRSPMTFRQGFWLQALNPKAIVFGLTIYTTFLSGITERPVLLTISVFLLATATFCSVSLWAFSGLKIQGWFHSKGVRQLVNLILFVLLVYCALSLAGIC